MGLFKDISNYIDGNINFYYRRQNAPKHIKEQILYRMLRCSSCVRNGKCNSCSCKVPHLFFAPEKKDGLNKWPQKFLLPENWKEFKTANKRDLLILLRSNPDILKKYRDLFA